MAAHQRVGDFVAVKVGDQIQKNGGNVASHFLTPDGRLIHSVTGPVSAQVLLEEASWATEMYQEAQTLPPHKRAMFVAQAHQWAAMSAIRTQDRQVHELLAQRPLSPLTEIYREVFEKILGEKVSEAMPRLAEASRRLDFAARSKRPLLFILYDGHHAAMTSSDLMTHRLVNEFVVIAMPIREGPALSQLTGQPPYEADRTARPLFVVAHSDGQQIASLSRGNASQLNQLLGQGLCATLERNPGTTGRLIRAQRLLRKVDPSLANQVRDLTIRMREKAKAEREARKDELSRFASR